MKLFNRIIYLGYYIKITDWAQFSKFVRYVSKEKKISKFKLWVSPFIASLKHNVSLLEYFLFRFWEKNADERKQWAGTGFMYEYQLKMNPIKYRSTLLNKAKFLEHNAQFISHRWFIIENDNFESLRPFLEQIKGKVVLKNVVGNCGIGLKVVDSSVEKIEDIISLARKNNLTLAEEYIYQHKDLMRLSPSGLNTVRIFTQVIENHVVILGARLRISVNCAVDNLAAGNMATFIDEKTGIIAHAAVYSDITKKPEMVHPITKVAIEGFQVPLWDLIIEKVKAIALHNKENRSVGWDIAVTDFGVDFIEGNHDWCKLVYQLPAGKGLKKELLKYV
jgi:hypothetical protein